MVIRSKALNVEWLDESRLQRLELMDDLRDQGLTYREISELLNLKGIISPTNKKYSPKLVERSLFKYRERQGRLTDTEIVSLKEHYDIKIDDLRSD